MIFKKAIALILSVAVTFCVAGCKASPEDTSSEAVSKPEQSTTQDYITLLYSAADTFNPYTVKTDINRQLCKLLFEPLIKLDNEFEPVYSIAQDAKLDKLKCTVSLKSVNFSDGSALTADDVVYSYKLARGSNSSYASKLYEVTSAVAADSRTVVFTLSKQDPYFLNLLDFPIIKSGSEKITDSDSVLQPPIGCGRYKVADDRQSLIINQGYFGKSSGIKSITLINAPDYESVAHYLEVGAADIYYSDISNGEILRMSGKKLDINLNNLVYIGVNQNYGALCENALRQAISSGIDRKAISRDAFYNNALPATGFFNPVWDATKSVQNIQIEAKSQITVENLEKIGYNRLDNKGNRVNANGGGLKFTMLVNSENRMRATAANIIATQLSQYGIKITVVEKKYADYVTALKEGNFQLFLGEIKLTDNMDFTNMVTEGGSAAYGLLKPEDDKASKDESVPQEAVANSGDVVGGFYKGVNTITDVAVVLQSEMPFIPICYRTGVLFCSDNIENVENSSASDIYFSIESYIYK